MIQEVVLHMYYMNLFTVLADLIFNLHIHYIQVFFQFDFVRCPVIPNPRGRVSQWEQLHTGIWQWIVFLIITINDT